MNIEAINKNKINIMRQTDGLNKLTEHNIVADPGPHHQHKHPEKKKGIIPHLFELVKKKVHFVMTGEMA